MIFFLSSRTFHSRKLRITDRAQWTTPQSVNFPAQPSTNLTLTHPQTKQTIPSICASQTHSPLKMQTCILPARNRMLFLQSEWRTTIRSFLPEMQRISVLLMRIFLMISFSLMRRRSCAHPLPPVMSLPKVSKKSPGIRRDPHLPHEAYIQIPLPVQPNPPQTKERSTAPDATRAHLRRRFKTA